MKPSPPPPESPVKDVDKEVEPGSLSRFNDAAKHLFGVDQAEFREAYNKDEAERAKRRALGRTAPRGKPPPDNLA